LAVGFIFNFIFRTLQNTNKRVSALTRLLFYKYSPRFQVPRVDVWALPCLTLVDGV